VDGKYKGEKASTILERKLDFSGSHAQTLSAQN
jgi:hypothetical protein